jgi:hypothetical protein
MAIAKSCSLLFIANAEPVHLNSQPRKFFATRREVNLIERIFVKRLIWFADSSAVMTG